MEVPFAALQQLCEPMLDRLERLPAPRGGLDRLLRALPRGPRIPGVVASLTSSRRSDSPARSKAERIKSDELIVSSFATDHQP